MRRFVLVLVCLLCAASVFAAESPEVKVDGLTLTVSKSGKVLLESAKWAYSFKMKERERRFGDCSLLRNCYGQFAILSPSGQQGYMITPNGLESVILPSMEFDTDDWDEASFTEFDEYIVEYIYARDKDCNLFVIVLGNYKKH